MSLPMSLPKKSEDTHVSHHRNSWVSWLLLSHDKVTCNVMNEAPMANETVDNLTIIPGQPFAYIIPRETFIDPDVGDALKFNASSVDGSCLPKWIQFISLECCFVGKPPKDLIENFELKIVLTATDFDGLSANTSFKILR